MTPTWAPQPEDVHAVIPHRNAGKPWTDRSQPTAQEVRLLIDGRAAEVQGELGGAVPTKWQAQAAHVVRLGVAADIELAYPSNPTGGSEGAGPNLLARYDASLERLRTNAAGDTGGTVAAAAAATGHAAPWGAQPARCWPYR